MQFNLKRQFDPKRVVNPKKVSCHFVLKKRLEGALKIFEYTWSDLN